MSVWSINASFDDGVDLLDTVKIPNCLLCGVQFLKDEKTALSVAVSAYDTPLLYLWKQKDKA